MKYVKCKICGNIQGEEYQDLGCYQCNSPSNWVEEDENGKTILYDSEGAEEIEEDEQ